MLLGCWGPVQACTGLSGAPPGFCLSTGTLASLHGCSHSCPLCRTMLLSRAGRYLDHCFSHWLRSACLGGDFRRRLAAWQRLLLGSIVLKEASFVLRLKSWTIVSGALFWLWWGPTPPHRNRSPRAKSMPTRVSPFGFSCPLGTWDPKFSAQMPQPLPGLHEPLSHGSCLW